MPRKSNNGMARITTPWPDHSIVVADAGHEVGASELVLSTVALVEKVLTSQWQ
jgi:hypothetical protein